MSREVERLNKRLTDHQSYIDTHEGKITAWWKAQHLWNADIESRTRLIERRILVYAASGGGGGVLIVELLKLAITS